MLRKTMNLKVMAVGLVVGPDDKEVSIVELESAPGAVFPLEVTQSEARAFAQRLYGSIKVDMVFEGI
jgi:hypothetical protein